VVWLIPVYLLLVNAFRPSTGYDADRIWVPDRHFSLVENVRLAWDAAGLGPSLASTLLYSVASPAFAVVLGAMAGFAIVVLRVRAGFWWFMLLFGGTVFPSQMLLIPLFLGYSSADLYDRRGGLILVYTAVSVPLPRSCCATSSAASRTTCSRPLGSTASIWRIFWRIYSRSRCRRWLPSSSSSSRSTGTTCSSASPCRRPTRYGR